MAARGAARKQRVGERAGITVDFKADEKALIREAVFHSNARSQAAYIRDLTLRDAQQVVTKARADIARSLSREQEAAPVV